MSTETTVSITPGTGANIDGFASGTSGAIRQAMVIADPTTAANAATVNAAGQLAVQAPSVAPGTVSVTAVSSDGTKATYRVSGVGVTPAATPTDFITITGSATKTVRVKSIRMTGIATTAGIIPVQFIRRSAANTGGTSAAKTAVNHDITDAAASAVVAVYSVNPTGLGTIVGAMATDRLFCNLTTAAPLPVVREFATRQDKAVILRGTADILAINFGGATLPSGAAVDFEIEWEEDNS